MIFIRMSDTGIGIDHFDMSPIFLPFERVETSFNRSFAGTGPGLVLTNNMGELHDGRLGFGGYIRDRGPNIWFTLTLYNPPGNYPETIQKRQAILNLNLARNGWLYILDNERLVFPNRRSITERTIIIVRQFTSSMYQLSKGIRYGKP